MMNNQKEEIDVLSGKNYMTSMISEEVKALSDGKSAYCFNENQLKLIEKICNEKCITFTYSKDEDGIYTLIPKRNNRYY